MKKLILKWLFGTEKIDDYMHVLSDCIDVRQRFEDEIASHIKTLREDQEHLRTIIKIIKICENHGIDVDEEIKHVNISDE